jgi:hypothetical protein
MKKTMMYLPEEMHRFLATEAAARGVSMAEVAREAIAEYRSKREQEAPPKGVAAIIGLFGDAISDPSMSASIDEELERYFAAGGVWESENGLADPSD